MTTVTISAPSRREDKKSRTRERLLEGAVALFARQGIESTTVDQIAAAADVGKGTVYNYFETKDDIVVAFLSRLERRFAPTVKRHANADAPLGEILARFTWSQLNAKSEYRSFVRAFLARMISHDESFLPYNMEMQAAVDANLLALFSRLDARGLMGTRYEIDDLLLAFKTMQLGLTMLWALEGSPWKATRGVIRSQMTMFANEVTR